MYSTRMVNKSAGKSASKSSRSKSSARWLQRQKRDFYVRQAQDKGQVSRAHYKLVQIDERFKLIRSNHQVLELGAAPGGWTNYIEGRLKSGRLIAIDPLPITAGARTEVIVGEFGSPDVDAQVRALLGNVQLDLVLSDMAPNMSGVRAVDQARSMDLADLALQACRDWLSPGGKLSIKAFQGEGLDDWVSARRRDFDKVTMTKPKASRPDSREVFVVAVGWRANRDAVDGLE